MTELIRKQSNQSKTAEIVNCYHQWQILNPSGKRKARRSFTISDKTSNGTEEEATLEGTTGMARAFGS
jgi:hypothetical protein